ncbi:MAG: DUF3368 domain-containing protein [Saprospiraceae bacterium]|nr:DUF3368 domain-containing protein [Saprospiraceae bacterium]MCF8249844.1 DUF3368 domain-containing protein [Saprospiraceae bacterium]MCF8279486.1 DUF3368 domain-containing protein [Bacteroidales bacterium]MCF8311722.1 DUF3368 domain-containing protein [Saprospiraceae bacterium]MCF8440289.1 DUF3368 domain-containing protein [Saprospiraceae bacterium]
MIVVSDTSPISNLLMIGWLRLLPSIYGKVIIPDAVYEEVEALSQFGVSLHEFYAADWIERAMPSDLAAVNELLGKLDEGESEAIILAEELKADFLLIDERLGWKEAQARSIKTIGLLGTLVKAKEMGLIPEVKPLIDALRIKAKFRMSDALIKHILKEAGE